MPRIPDYELPASSIDGLTQYQICVGSSTGGVTGSTALVTNARGDLAITATWTGTSTYTALKVDVGTDSGPANAASTLLDLQVGGSSKFLVTKAGGLTFGAASGNAAVISSTTHATKGLIAFGDITTGLIYDELNGLLGVGGPPTNQMDVAKAQAGHTICRTINGAGTGTASFAVNGGGTQALFRSWGTSQAIDSVMGETILGGSSLTQTDGTGSFIIGTVTAAPLKLGSQNAVRQALTAAGVLVQGTGATFSASVTTPPAGYHQCFINDVAAAGTSYSLFQAINHNGCKIVHVYAGASQNADIYLAAYGKDWSGTGYIGETTGLRRGGALVSLSTGAFAIGTVGAAKLVLGTQDANRLTITADGYSQFASRYEGNKGANVASGETITLGAGNLFYITGTTDTKYCTTTGWQAGSVVKVYFEGAVVMHHNEGTVPTNTAAFFFEAGADVTTSAGTTMEFAYDGTYWREWN